jgi:hypothetical protein
MPFDCLTCCSDFEEEIILKAGDNVVDFMICCDCINYLKDQQYSMRVEGIKKANCLREFKSVTKSGINPILVIEGTIIDNYTVNGETVSSNITIPEEITDLDTLNKELYDIYEKIKDLTDDMPVTLEDFDYITEMKNVLGKRNI